MKYTRAQARRILRDNWYHLTADEREFLERTLDKTVQPRDLNQEFTDQRTFGEKVADKVAEFGGSWTFIMLFMGFLLSWALINSVILLKNAFDPYQYIFLNLLLSMLAAIQAPIIMMSQNRQSKRDRLDAEIDHEVNVRAELTLYHLNKQIHRIEHQLELLNRQLGLTDEEITAAETDLRTAHKQKAHTG